MTCRPISVLAVLACLMPASRVAAAEEAQPGAPKSAAEGVRAEAVRSNADPEGRPLPLACSWTCGHYPQPPSAGWRPENQIRLIEQGHFLLPWFDHTSCREPVPGQGDFFFKYYEAAMKRAAELKLPLVFIASQWERELSVPELPYFKLPPEQNPNVVDAEGKILPMVSPFGPVEPWKQIGRTITDIPRVKKLQEWYPDPPLVIFLSNNEHTRLQWPEVEKDARYLAKNGKGKPAEFKRQAVAEGWIERYRALQAGLREGLAAPDWRKNALFVGYDAFGPPHFARWSGWQEHALATPERISPHPLMWDGASPSYYTHNWDESTDYRAWSPQVEFMNLVFMKEEALRLNPNFWFELSVWDGYAPGAGNDKRKTYAKLGQSYTPARYAGFVQYGMWLLRPRAVREYRDWTHPWDQDRAFFMALVESVDRVHLNPVLREWWRKGELVPNRAHPHPYQADVPKACEKADRWFLLDASVNEQNFPWALTTAVPVFSLALVQGRAPERRWLLYTHAPLGERKGVKISIPDFREVTVTVPVAGAFFTVDEKSGEVAALPAP